MTEQTPGPAQPRPLGEQLAGLMSSVQDWLHAHADGAADAGGRAQADEDAAAATDAGPEPGAPAAGSQCQGCPWCQVLTAVRGEHPELTRRIADAGTAMLAALRTLLDAVVEAAASAGAAARDEQEPAAPRVQHIDLSEPS